MAGEFMAVRAALLAQRPMALHTPLEELVQRTRDRKLQAMLHGLRQKGFDTVDDLLSEGDVMLAGRHLRKPRQAVLGLVQGLLKVEAPPSSSKAGPVSRTASPASREAPPAAVRATPASGVAAPGATPPPPPPGTRASVADLVAWHRAAGATWVLAEPLRAALRDPRAPAVSVEAFLEGPLAGFDGWRIAQVRTYLLASVEDVQQSLRQEELDAPWLPGPPLPEPAEALRVALVDLRAELRKVTCPMALRDGTVKYHLTRERVPTAGVAWVGDREGSVTLPLAAAGMSRASLEVDAPRAEAHALGLALVDLLLKALRDPEHPLRGVLLEQLSLPSWQRGLQLILDQLPDPTPQRLVWTVAPDELAVVRVRRGQRGWLKPEPVTVEKLLVDGVGTAQDRRALDLLAQYPDLRRQRQMTGLGAVLQAQVLDILEGHPDLVRADGSEARLAIRRCALEVRLVLIDEALVLRPHFAGQLRSWEAQATLLERASGDTGVWLEGEACWLITLPPAVRKALEAAAHYDLALRPEEVPAALPQLLTLVERLGLDLDPSLGQPAASPRRLVLRLTPEGADGAWGELRVQVDPALPTFLPGEGPEHLPVQGDDGIRILARDRAAERRTASQLAAELGLGQAGYRRMLTTQEALRALSAAEARDDVAVELPEGGWRITRAGLAGLKLGVQAHAGGFRLEGGLEVDDTTVALAVLLEARRRDERFVTAGEGRVVGLDDDLSAALDEAMSGLEARGTKVVVVPAGLRQAEGLLAAAASGPRPPDWQARLQRLAEADDLEPELPEALQADLRPYQATGYAWMMRLAHQGLGAVLADEMGLGKTVQTIAVLAARGAAGPALVVTPTSVSHGWLRELGRFAPTLDARLYRGPARAALLRDLGPGAVLITSYDLLVRDVEALAALPFATVVLDEAQAIKNPGARRSQAARALQAGFRLALTGTPIENDVQDLWSVLDAVSPGLLGQREAFLGRFGPVPGDARATGRRLERLARLVQPFLLRRTKRAVAPELPERTVVRVDVALSAPERALYRSVHAAAVREISEAVVPGLEADRRFQVLAALTRLRQLACHPRLYQRDSALPSAKHERLMGLLEALMAAGQRALVFSQFVRQLDLLQEALHRAGIPFLVLTGSTPASERARRVEAFQAGEGAVFLISLKAGGTGLNLTEADAVIHMDPWWNPAAEDQASDRAHRIGRRRPVTIYRLVAEGTIEAAIVDLQDDKRATADAVLGGASAGAKLTTEDLAALIRAGLDDPEADDA
ncbi:MAG: DEAD/DEAH box helicase [Deltaproteobacteria bacterium]|nr:DEAD/DEAH box helicase [Deltaproteobacteria bacterium]